MDLIFGGDIAWPSRDVLDLSAVRRWAEGQAFVLNLEGPIIPAAAEVCEVEDVYKFNIYSDDSVLDALKGLNVVACGLANNHIADYRAGLDHTLASLAGAGVQSFGARGKSWCRIEQGGREYVLWAACTRLPEPTRLPAGRPQASLLEPHAALRELGSLRKEFPGAVLVAYVHWGYELARYPQPADREWARRAIELGVNHVIGHHPHVVQGLEAHGQGQIAYSLGNFALPQVAYRGRVLRYKSQKVCDQLVLRHAGEGLRSAWMRYDLERQIVTLVEEHEALKDPRLAELTPFAGLSDAQYREWFRAHGQQATELGRAAGPTLWGIEGRQGLESRAKLAYLDLRKKVRRLAIQSGLHKPYNW